MQENLRRFVIPLLFFTLLIASKMGFAVPNRAYVANETSSTISVIDTTTNNVIQTIVSPPGSGVFGVTVTPDGKFVYATNNLTGTISVIDTNTNAITSTITGLSSPELIAFTPDGKFAYVTENNSFVAVINTATNTVIQTIPGFSNPLGLAINPAGTHCYVADNIANSVRIIDIATNTVTLPPISTSGTPARIAINAAGTRAYVTVLGLMINGGLTVLDLTTNTFLQQIDLMSLQAEGVALTPDGLLAYVTTLSSNSVVIVNLTTNTLSGMPITVLGTPDAIAITPDGKFAYVTQANIASVAVIDTTSRTVVHSTMVGNGPIDIAITPPPPPPSPPPPQPITPPSPINLTGLQQKGANSGLEQEYVNTIHWQANPNATGVVGYFVYRDGIKIATLGASTFIYEDHNRKKGATTLYAVTSFIANGTESEPTIITVN